MKKRLLIVYTGIGLIIIGIAFILFLLYTSSAFVLKNIHINGNRIISARLIKKRSGLEYGKALISIDIKKVKQNLLLERLISDVKVEKVFPDSVSINVIESNPIILLVLDDKTYLLDKNAIVMEIANKSYENNKFIRVEFLDDSKYQYSIKDKIDIHIIKELLVLLMDYKDNFIFLSQVKSIKVKPTDKYMMTFKNLNVTFVYDNKITKMDLEKSNIIYKELITQKDIKIDTIIISENSIIGN